MENLTAPLILLYVGLVGLGYYLAMAYWKSHKKRLRKRQSKK